MTCTSCVKLVEGELHRLGLKNISVKLGEVKIIDNKKVSLEKIRTALVKQGFDLVQNRNDEIAENIRLTILNLINNNEGIDSKVPLSVLLEKQVALNYKYLSKIFSRNKGISIEKYFILTKIEKAKELIQYGELSFTEIAYHLGYTNPQHLSNQFKKIVGCTMTDIRDKQAKKRISMNKL